MKLQKKKNFFFFGGGGGGVGVGLWGGQDGCERRIEVFVKIKKKMGGGSGWGGWGGQVGGDVRGGGGGHRVDVNKELWVGLGGGVKVDVNKQLKFL